MKSCTNPLNLNIPYAYISIPYSRKMFSYRFRLYGLSKISADIYNGAPLRT